MNEPIRPKASSASGTPVWRARVSALSIPWLSPSASRSRSTRLVTQSSAVCELLGSSSKACESLVSVVERSVTLPPRSRAATSLLRFFASRACLARTSRT